MIRKILTIPQDEAKLRQKSVKVVAFDQNLEQIIKNLSDTLQAQTDPPGLGLSAPQIGIFKQVFVARNRNKIKAFINPKILKFSKKQIAYLEGCFSIPDLYGHVIRSAEIDLESCNKHGKVSKSHYKGLPARITQHEIDHLNGVLFTDHIHTQNGKVFKVKKDRRGKEQFVEVTGVLGTQDLR